MKSLSSFSLLALLLLGAGCVSGATPEVVSKLTIEQETYMVNDEPAGYLVKMEGVVTQNLLLTPTYQNDYNNQSALLNADGPGGEVVYEEGYFWAGVNNKLRYVRNGDRLILEEQISLESGEVRYQDLAMMEVPSSVSIEFVE